MHNKKSMIFVAIALFFITILAGSPLGASARMQTPPGEDACRFPNAIATSGRPAEAAAQYLVLLERSPGLQCAEDGYLAAINSFDPFVAARALVADGDENAAAEEIKRVSEAYPGAAVPADLAHLVSPPEAADPFAAVRALNNAGLITQAKAAFARVVQENFQGPVPEDLKHLGQAADPFAAVRALDDEGLVKEAKEAFSEVVKANPDAAIPNDLRHLDGRQSLSCDWSNLQDCAQSITNWMTEKLKWILPLLGYLFVAFLIVFAPLRWVYNRRSKTLDIGAFETSSTGDSIGSALAESIQENYERLKSDQPLPGIKLIADAIADEKVTIPSVIPGDTGNMIQQFLGWAWNIQRKPYLFSGTTIADSTLGAGLILHLKHNNEVIRTSTIWYRDLFDPARREESSNAADTTHYVALGESAAIQLYSWLTDEPNGSDRSSGTRPTALSYHAEWRNWESFAFFRNSVKMRQCGKTQIAIDLLNNSLNHDPYFIPARMNLATLEFQERLGDDTTPPAEVTDAIDSYAAQLASMWNNFPVKAIDRTLRPRVLFNFLAALDYQAGWEGQAFPPCMEALTAELNNYQTSAGEGASTLKSALKSISDGLKIRQGTPAERRAVMDECQGMFGSPLTSSMPYGASGWYGNACLCAAAFHAAQADEQELWATTGLEYLRKAIDRKPDLTKWASVDPSLTPFRTTEPYSAQLIALLDEYSDDEPTPSEPPV